MSTLCPLTSPPTHPRSEAELEALCEQLYEDGLAAAAQAALYVLNEEEGGQRDEPPGAACPPLLAAAAAGDTVSSTAAVLQLGRDCRRCWLASAGPAAAAAWLPPLLSSSPRPLRWPSHRPPQLPSTPGPAAAPLELSLVLCDDAHIAALNAEWRGVEGPTDVLSFELEDDEDETGCRPEVRRGAAWPRGPPVGAARVLCNWATPAGWLAGRGSGAALGQLAGFALARLRPRAGPTPPPACLHPHPHLRTICTPVCRQHAGLALGTRPLAHPAEPNTPLAHAPQLPVNVLGDVVISLDTAARQAAERGCGLRDEARVLLVHGVLHLFGFDHEEGALTRWWSGGWLTGWLIESGWLLLALPRAVNPGLPAARSPPPPSPLLRDAQTKRRRRPWRPLSGTSSRRWAGRGRASSSPRTAAACTATMTGRAAAAAPAAEVRDRRAGAAGDVTTGTVFSLLAALFDLAPCDRPTL